MIIDATRMIVRRSQTKTFTGIDRVCLAYIERYKDTAYAMCGYGGTQIVLDKERSKRLFDLILDVYSTPKKACFLFAKLILSQLFTGKRVDTTQKILLNIGHMGADSNAYFKKINKMRVCFVPMIHDIIPVKHPPFASGNNPSKHKTRIDGFIRNSKAIITNSETTKKDVLHYVQEIGLIPPTIKAIRIGVNSREQHNAVNVSVNPYFVVIGTIEIRKNHLLLLNIWEELSKKLGNKTPRLYIIGKRGWKNKETLSKLDLMLNQNKFIVEINSCSDSEMFNIIKNANAVLFPSFAEGYGLPLAESLALNVPVIASPLDAFKEIAGDIPVYISPTNTKGWTDMIIAFCDKNGSIRKDAIEKTYGFKIDTWEKHFIDMERFIFGVKNDYIF